MQEHIFRIKSKFHYTDAPYYTDLPRPILFRSTEYVLKCAVRIFEKKMAVVGRIFMIHPLITNVNSSVFIVQREFSYLYSNVSYSHAVL